MQFLLIALVSIGIALLVFLAARFIPVWQKPSDPIPPQPTVSPKSIQHKRIFLTGLGKYPGLSGNSHQRIVKRRKLGGFFDSPLS